MNLRQAMSRFQNTIYARAVRHGLTLAIPFLIMGSFALLLTNFPLGVYQDFIRTWMNGAASAILETLYQISLGSLALVLTVTISISYGHLTETDQLFLYPIVAVCSYLAFCGGIENQSDYIFNAEWVFTAMVITLLSCVLFHKILKLGHRFERLHTTGADYLFNISIQCLIPVILVSLFFAVTGYVLRVAWDSSNITNFGSYLFLKLFDKISGNLFGILLYVVMTHLLWFMGIHGTNTLEAVSRHLFEQNVEINQSLVLAGHIPTEIFSKTFLDTLVFIGGCGTALSFVLALYIASKQSHNRKMSFVALPSALFNYFQSYNAHPFYPDSGNPDIDQRIGYQGRACTGRNTVCGVDHPGSSQRISGHRLRLRQPASVIQSFSRRLYLYAFCQTERKTGNREI